MTAKKKALRAPAAKQCRGMAEKAAPKSVNAVFSANRVLAGGVSNTPHSDIYVKSLVDGKPLGFVNVCVDYLKVRFDGSFDKGSSSLRKLWSFLCVDPDCFVKGFGMSGYKSSFFVEEGLSVMYGGDFTRNKDGAETWLLDMKGSGCRSFEQRVAFSHPGSSDSEVDFFVKRAWADLVREILSLNGVCTRVDLPTDDFSGIVPFDGLKERCESRSYQSNMRSFSLVPSFGDCEPDPGFFNKSNKRNVQGWSYTMGSRESVQLCIYDKKAEREVNTGNDVLVSSWIRYECRFYHDNAVTALNMLSNALDDGDVASFIVSVLAGSIRFIGEEGPYRGNNRAQGRVWSPWARFVSGYDVVRVVSQSRAESTVESNAKWLDLDASKAFARLAGSDPSLVGEYVRFFLNSGVSKLDGKDLFSVNSRRRSKGLEPYKTVQAMVSGIISGSKDFVDVLQDVPDSVIELFGKAVLKNGSASIVDLKKKVSSDDGGMYGDLDRLTALYGDEWHPDAGGKGGGNMGP